MVGEEPITCAALVSGRRAAGVVGGGAGREVPARLGFGGRHAGGLPACTIGFLDRQGVEAVVQRNGMRGA